MIDKPVEGVKTVARAHPPGAKGAHLSLDECAQRAWKARMSPRLRAWVTQVLAACGVSRGSRRDKGQCVLSALRKKIPYVADPVLGEFMATPDQVLCLDEGGLCIVGSDCDEMAITLAAAMMSIGIDAMIVGSSHHDPANTPTHVYMAFEDDSGSWVRMDGTTQYPVGKVAPYRREWWVEPGKDAKETGTGDFVGMSEDHAQGSLGAAPTLIDLYYSGIL